VVTRVIDGVRQNGAAPHGGFRRPHPPARRGRGAHDAPAAASLVLHRAEHRAACRASRHAPRSARSSLEDRTGRADLVSAREDVWREIQRSYVGHSARHPGEPLRRDAGRASQDWRIMNQGLSLAQVVILCGYAAGMAAGQILFKLASMRLAPGDSVVERISGLFQNWLFIAALAIYLALSLLWVWILSFTPLSRAYLFVALSF